MSTLKQFFDTWDLVTSSEAFRLLALAVLVVFSLLPSLGSKES